MPVDAGEQMMKMQVTAVREPDGWSRALTIEVDGGAVQQEIEQELRKLRRSVDLPGFRKGKAPMTQLRARYGKEVEKDVVERLLGEAVQQAIEEQALAPLAAPRVEDVSREGDGPLTFTAHVDVEPTVELGNYEGIKIDKLVRPVTDEEVRAAIEELRLRRARLEPVTRPAAAGDVLTVHLSALGPGQVPIVGSRREGLRLLLDPASMPAPWVEALVGRQAGERVVVAQPRPAGEQPPPGVVATGGEERYDSIELLAVEVRHLPELDDAFARQVSKVDSLAALEELVRKNLEAEEERRSRHQVEQALLDRIAEPLGLEIPERVLERAAADLFASVVARHPELSDAERERLRGEARTEAARRMRHELVVAAIGRREGVEVTRSEAEEAVAALSRGKGEGEPRLDGTSREKMIESLRESLYERKVLNLLVDRADLQVIEQSPKRQRIVTPFDT